MEAYVRFCDGTHEVRNLRQLFDFFEMTGTHRRGPTLKYPASRPGGASDGTATVLGSLPAEKAAPLTLIPGTRKKSLSPLLNFHQNRRMLWAGGRGAGGYPEISKFFENAKSFLRTRNPI